MRLGLRLEWLLAFGALLVLSFVPLFFAVSRLTEASMANLRERSARELGRAIAGHVADAAAGREQSEIDALLDAQVDDQVVVAIAVYEDDGSLRAARGAETASLPARIDGHAEVSKLLGGTPSRLLVVVPGAKPRVTSAVLLSVDATTGPAGPLVRLMALYTGVVGLALLVFGYFLMTRLVVKPTEELSRAAGRVAAGGQSLEVPKTGSAELRELGESLRAMTENLRADEESLRTKVVELENTTRDLKNAQETLVRSERLASVGRLAAGLAHEVGNPIAAILGFQELLLAGDLSPEETKDFLERMKRETERIHRVLRDLLDFARAPGKKLEVDASPGDAAHAIEAVVTLIAPQRELQGVEIVRDVEPGAPLVALAEEQLVQLLLNLLLNAADAVPKTGGRVRISLHANPNGGAIITVEDNGPGIDEAVAATLFEPFVTTKEVGKGTGLGLSVCKGLVDSAGGTISVKSGGQLGGASFVVELPAYAPPSDPGSANRKRSP